MLIAALGMPTLFLRKLIKPKIYVYVREQWHLDLVAELDDKKLLTYFSQDLNNLANQGLAARAALQQLTVEEFLAHILQQAQQAKMLPAEMTLQQMTHLWQVFKANFQALSRYTPAPYPGSLVLFRAGTPATTEASSWEGLAERGMAIHWISGDHYTIVQKPQVQTLAEYVAAYLVR